ncbi:MAG: AbrB/MazE/SpoVT family DNA-binding domain-containing protein [Nitrososphaerales archaeon]
MASTGKVARKRALYPTKSVMDILELKEGQFVKYTIEDKKLVVEPVRDPHRASTHKQEVGENNRKGI